MAEAEWLKLIPVRMLGFSVSAKYREENFMKALKEMNLLDDFLFNAVVSYNEKGEFFSRELLKTIFGREFGELIITPQKPYYGLDTCYHGIRLDVQVEEQTALAIPNTVFDIELDNDKDDKDDKSSLPKRTRLRPVIPLDIIV